MSAEQRDEALERFLSRVKAKSPGLSEEEALAVARAQHGDFVRTVNDDLALFMNERNGLSIWRAIRKCHQQGEPIPPNIVAKLADWANRLESANSPSDIARELDLAGDVKDYKGRKHLDAIERRRAIASEVELVRNTYKLTKNAAITIVARNQGLTVAGVHKDYYEFFKNPKAKDGPPALQAAIRAWRSKLPD